MPHLAHHGLADPARLAAVRRTGLLDAPPDPALDRLTRLAARLLRAPVAVVTVLDRDRQFFASCVGLPEPWASARQSPLSHSFCQHVIGSGAPLAVEDAREHPLVRENLAVAALGVVAYLGVPLTAAGGERLGALAVIDRTVRAWSDDDREVLAELAASVMTEVVLRQKVQQEEAATRALAEAQRVGRIGSWELDVATREVRWSAELYRLSGLEPSDAPVTAETFSATVHPDDRERFREELRAHLVAARPYEFTYRVLRPDGAVRVLRGRAGPVHGPDGAVARIVGTAQDVTEQVEAELALRESEARYADVAANVPGMVYQFVYAADGTGRYTFASEGTQTLFGVAPEDALRDPAALLDRLHPAERAAFVARARDAAATLSPFRWEGPVVLAGGQERFVQVVARARRRADGSVVSDGLVTDLTELRRATQRLAESEERFRLAVAATRDMIFDLDFTTGRVVREGAVEEILGLPADAMLPTQTGWLDRVHPDDRPRVESTFAVARAAGGSDALAFEYRMRRPGGDVAHVRVRARLLRDDAGRAVRMVGAVSDVTQQRMAEAALRASEARFRGLVEHSAELIAVVGADGRMAYGSPAFQRHLGYTADELRDRDGLALVHPDDLPVVGPMLQSLVSEPGGVRRAEYRARHRDGSWRTVSGIAHNLLHEPAVAGIVVNARDVTEERALAAQLRQAQRMEAVGRLAGGVAHDFNNIVQVITANALLAAEALPAGAAARGHLAEINAAAGRAAALTRQLLAFSRLQVLTPEPLDLNRVVAAVERMLQRVIGANVVLATDPRPEIALVHADAGQMEQVLVNLVLNARDALPHGGRVTIETRQVQFDATAAAQYPGLAAGVYVALRVTDTGVGMDRATRARVFEPFFTTKDPGRGTGLGLSTVYGIVKQSGGYVWVDSAPGAGSTFTVLLPPYRDDTTAQAVVVAPAAARGGSELILLVHDEAPVRSSIRHLLERGGYAVLEAANGDEALRALDECPRAVDLVLTDVVMPGRKAIDLLDRLRERHPGVRALLMSGYEGGVVADWPGGIGGVELLEKPFEPAELLRSVRAALDVRPAP